MDSTSDSSFSMTVCMFNFEQRRYRGFTVRHLIKILLVEGNVQLRSLTKKLIETREGWHVSEAADGHDAIGMVSKVKPDLVVLDFALAGLNGFQTAERISSNFPGLPILLYTFYAFEVMSAEAKKHGIREVINKTVRGDYLLERIECHLKEAGLSRTAFAETVVNSAAHEEPSKLA